MATPNEKMFGGSRWEHTKKVAGLKLENRRKKERAGVCAGGTQRNGVVLQRKNKRNEKKVDVCAVGTQDNGWSGSTRTRKKERAGVCAVVTQRKEWG